MPVMPVAHSTWQILRTAKRSRRPVVGLDLRLVPTRKTKTGEFLTDLVRAGLLDRVSGTEKAPFEATYKLTALGEHAAEFGECEVPIEVLRADKPGLKPARAGKRR